ncbi:sodium:calcium antiporter [Endozoicomonas sp.]|uniref:sodium:calcium antiporter n=1 Tax=Endozoicomonas sp. TaxID=1892382 RepID=UPI003AF50BF9
MGLLGNFAILIFVSVVIKYACDTFEQSAVYLGRNMSEGVKGGLINAVGSSLPEMLTTFSLLFFLHDEAGFAAGVSVTVGSAVFNAIVIPLTCILAVRFYGVRGQSVKSFTISKTALKRDGFWLLLGEVVLIFMLIKFNLFHWWMGAALIIVYLGYLVHMLKSGSHDGEDDYEFESLESSNILAALIKFDFNKVFFNDKPLSKFSAWINLFFATLIIAIACHFLSLSVVGIADGLNIPVYLSALVFAAAATSVPDTFLSIKDAVKGQYDDAVSNAFGSNTFDITVALGLPLLVYGLIYGTVPMPEGTDIAVLRVLLVVITLAVLLMFYIPKKVTGYTASGLAALFAVWVGYLIWASQVGGFAL